MAAKKKAVLSVEIDADLKERFGRLADKRGRKLNKEVEFMMRDYLDREEPKEGIESDDE